MDQPGFQCKPLANLRVVIWGLGLMGGSIAMALNGKCAFLAGIDQDPEVVFRAAEKGILSVGLAQAGDVLREADVVLLATPVRTILASLEELPRLVLGPALVLDLGSTKREIVEKMEDLPARFELIGGHPMCGKEKGSFANADAAIYHHAPFALVSPSRTSVGARDLAEQIALAVGAYPLWIDAQTHDRWVAATSHTPFLLASALSRVTPVEAGPLVGPGFRSTTRLAASPAKMMVDILATNSDNIKEMLSRVQDVLEVYRLLIERQEYQRLADELALGAEQYRALVKEREL